MSTENINLALNTHWRYRPFDYQQFTLPPGATKKLCDIRKPGSIVWSGITFNNPLLNCLIELESESELYSNTFNAAALIFAGLTVPTVAGWWMSRVDFINGVFSACFTPPYPGWAFNHRLSISLVNNAVPAVPIIIFRAALICIEFGDAQK